MALLSGSWLSFRGNLIYCGLSLTITSSDISLKAMRQPPLQSPLARWIEHHGAKLPPVPQVTSLVAGIIQGVLPVNQKEFRTVLAAAHCEGPSGIKQVLKSLQAWWHIIPVPGNIPSPDHRARQILQYLQDVLIQGRLVNGPPCACGNSRCGTRCITVLPQRSVWFLTGDADSRRGLENLLGAQSLTVRAESRRRICR